MSLIRKSNELKIQSIMKMMIYGQAGTGKTTLALSATKPILLLDFDNGVKRVNENHLDDNVGIVQVTSWQDVLNVMNEDLSEFKTIVVDTIGKMMDFIIAYRCGQKQPRVQDWSAINTDFKNFVDQISNLGKHVIFIAHRDTRKGAKDDTVFVPALREKNYNSIVTELDLMGYLEMKNENGFVKRSITFDPTDVNDGKNTCQLPGVMYLQTILDKNGKPTGNNDFLEKNVIAKYNQMIGNKQAKVEEYNKALADIEESISTITDAAGANHFLKHIGEYSNFGNSLIMKARDLFGKKVKAIGLTYNKETKQYEDAAQA